MEFKIEVPTCPVCEGICTSWSVTNDHSNVVQRLVFECDAGFTRYANATFENPLKPYGVMSEWASVSSCNKAQEIALKLRAEAKERHTPKPSPYARGGIIHESRLPPAIGLPPEDMETPL